MLKPTVKGYLAGIIDGEGYIGITNRGRSPRVVVTSTDERLARELTAMTQMGYASVCKRRSDGRRMTAWQWLCLGQAAFALLRQICPLLIIKREQAECMLQFADYLNRRPNAAAPMNKANATFGLKCAEQIRALNSRQRGMRFRRFTQKCESNLWDLL